MSARRPAVISVTVAILAARERSRLKRMLDSLGLAEHVRPVDSGSGNERRETPRSDPNVAFDGHPFKRP